MIKAGSLDQRITLQKRSSVVDSIGQPVESWADVAYLWANVRHLSGAESIRSGAPASQVKASIRIRPMSILHSGVDSGMRVLHGAAVYQVEAVLPHGRDWIDLVCVLTT